MAIVVGDPSPGKHPYFRGFTTKDKTIDRIAPPCIRKLWTGITGNQPNFIECGLLDLFPDVHAYLEKAGFDLSDQQRPGYETVQTTPKINFETFREERKKRGCEIKQISDSYTKL